MKKGLILLACLFALGMTQAVSAENVGLGFEFNTGLMLPMNGFSANGAATGFTLSWLVSDTLSVGVAREQISVRGKKSYKAESVAGQPDAIMVSKGTVTSDTIRLMQAMPFLENLQLGLEFGSANVNITHAAADFTRSDGSAATFADFGYVAVGSGDCIVTTPVVGLAGKFVLLNSKSKGIWTDWNIGACYQFAPIADVNLLGATSALATTVKKFDPVTDFNNVIVTTGITIGF